MNSQQQANHANSKNPHHLQYWRSRGYPEEIAKKCASAGQDVSGGVGQRTPTSRARASSRGPSGRQKQERSSNPGISSRGRSASPGRRQVAVAGQQAPQHKTAIESILQLPGGDSRKVQLTSQQRNMVAPMHLSLLIDTSGSMAGTSIDNVTSQCAKMLGTVEKLSNTAKASVFHFDEDVRNVNNKMLIKNIKRNRLKAEASESASRGGRTAFYDAVMEGLKGLKAYHTSNNVPDMHYFLLAFTDGCDNVSRHSLSDVQKALAHPGLPNFHFFIISAGLGSNDKTNMDRIVSGKKNCQHLPAGSTSKSDLEKAFKEFTTHMEELLTLRIISRAGAAPAMQQVINSMQNFNLKGHVPVIDCGNNRVLVEEIGADGASRGSRSCGPAADGRRGRSRSRSRR